MTSVIRSLTEPATLFTRAQILDRMTSIPKTAGFYGWYFRELPDGVPKRGCVIRRGATLLYVGIAPSSAASRSELRSRLRQHMRGNASGSTLRFSLGCLLAGQLRITLGPTPSGRLTFGPGERVLSEWLDKHALVAVHPMVSPWRLEADVAQAISLPLNLEHNSGHAFRSELSAIRGLVRETARTQTPWPARRAV